MLQKAQQCKLVSRDTLCDGAPPPATQQTDDLLVTRANRTTGRVLQQAVMFYNSRVSP
jgi:hypothetical protein